jgi:hypothetical protein
MNQLNALSNRVEYCAEVGNLWAYLKQFGPDGKKK